MEISLKSITLFNFRSFTGLHTLNFPKNGLIGVIGRYSDDPDISNGSGKSSLLFAINYLHLINDLPNSELQSWKDEESFYVEGIYDYAGEELKIKRGSGIFEITYKNHLTFAEDAKKLFTRLFLEPDILDKLTYKRQQSEGIFIPLTSSERYNFLFKITDLEKIETLVDKAKKNITSKEEECKTIQYTIDQHTAKLTWTTEQKIKIEEQAEAIKNHIYNVESDLVVLIEPKKDDLPAVIQEKESTLGKLKESEPQEFTFVDKDKLKVVNDQLIQTKNSEIMSADEDYQIKVESLKTEFMNCKTDEEKILLLEKEINDFIIKDEDQKSLLASKISAFEKFYNDPQDIKDLYEQALVAQKKLDEKKGGLVQSCPTCLQSLTDRQHERIVKNERESIERHINAYISNKDFIEEILVDIKQLEILNSSNHKEKLNDIKFKKVSIQSKKTALEKGIDNLFKVCELEFQNAKERKTGRLNDLNNQLFRIQEESKTKFLQAKNRWINQINSLENEIQKQKQNVEDKFTKALESYQLKKNELSVKISMYKNELKKANEIKEDYSKQLSDIEKDLEKQVVGLDAVKQSIKLELEIVNALSKDGFSKVYLGDILTNLGYILNSNLDKISVTEGFSVMLDSERTLKNNNVKADINLMIYKNGREISYKTLSGGQKSAVNWACDSAIQSLITAKHGKIFNFILLDEPFGGMDFKNKTDSVELLKRFSDDKMILITDHSKLNDSIDNFIEIEYRNGSSSIVSP